MELLDLPTITTEEALPVAQALLELASSQGLGNLCMVIPVLKDGVPSFLCIGESGLSDTVGDALSAYGRAIGEVSFEDEDPFLTTEIADA